MLSPVLTVVPLAEDISASAVLQALNSKPFSCGKITIAPCSCFAAPDEALLPFKSAKFSWREVAASKAAPDSRLLPPFPLINGCRRRVVSKRQKDRQTRGKYCEYSRFHVFVSLLRIKSPSSTPKDPGGCGEGRPFFRIALRRSQKMLSSYWAA